MRDRTVRLSLSLSLSLFLVCCSSNPAWLGDAGQGDGQAQHDAVHGDAAGPPHGDATAQGDGVAHGDAAGPTDQGSSPADQGPGADAATPAARPNILYILLDDAGYTDYGQAATTDSSIVQPNMKQLAQQSMRFEQFYTAPMCTPTRMSQLSGRYPMRYGILWVCGSNAVYGIPAAHDTLPQALKARGYHTATIGKWHSGQGRTEYQSHAKFDYSVVSRGPVAADGYFDPSYTINGVTKAEHPGKHLTDVTADYVVSYINQRAKAGKPFFLNYWLNAPHGPHTPSPRWEKVYCGGKTGSDCPIQLRYKATLSQGDEAIGRVLAALDAHPKLRQNTIVLLHSDNGGTAKTHPQGNGPLRGFKTDVFEGGTRLPLYVRWPGIVKPGAVNQSVVAIQDIFPTLAQLSGATAPKGLPGHSFASLILGTKTVLPRSAPLYWSHKVANEHVATTAGNVLVSHAVRQDNWKLVYEPLDRAQPFLFDLSQSSSEKVGQDLSAQQPARVSAMQQLYLDWLLDTGRISVAVKSLSGSVAQSGDLFTFSGAGGIVTLKNRPSFDITRLDFTFAARVRPQAGGALRIIASQAGSWALRINSNNRLELKTTGAGGKQVTTTGTHLVAAGKQYDVAFVVYAFKSLNSVLRIYRRDVASGNGFTLEADVEIPPFAPNTSTVRLGVGGQGNWPYIGTLRKVQMFRAPLTKSQVKSALDT